MIIALTRAVPPSIARCELTHLAREPIDVGRAVEEHRRYEAALARLGCTVHRLPPEPELPDSVFVEDTAVVLPGLAILTRPGAESRRAEVPSAAEALRPYRPLAEIEAPGTLDGGDVLVLGSEIFVGKSERTNAAGLRQLEALAGDFGYAVQPVSLSGCLHLKTAVTRVTDTAVLLNPNWIDPAVFSRFDRIEVDEGEPFAANVLAVGESVLVAEAFPRTRRRLVAAGVRVEAVAAGELAKAEGGLTCCSLLVEV